MKRLLLLALAVAALAPSTASAAVPCRDRIYNDWYADGKIATSYSLGCYRDALKHIPADARTYSSLADDIRSAMQGAQARLHGGTAPAQVGKGAEPVSQTTRSTTRTSKPTKKPTRSTTHTSKPTKKPTTSTPKVEPVRQTLTTSTVASGQTGGGSGVPVPLLVLGGLALLLIAVGGAGAIVKRRRI